MTKLPLVTVGITNFNNELYLAACIESVLNQSYPNVEVIVVDDASTDSSPDILKSYSNRINIINHSNNSGSLVQGRKDVINSAKGEFIAHMDADDFWNEKFIERLMVEFQLDPEIDWVVGNTNLVNSGGFVVNKWSYADFPTEFEACIKKAFTSASLPFPNNGIFKTYFLKRNNLSWYRFPNTLQGEDALTSTKYLECNPKLKHVDEYLFNYRLHGANMSAKPDERIKMILDLKEYYFSSFSPKILFNDRKLVMLDQVSQEFQSLSHYLLARDLLEIKQNIKIPAAFTNDTTEKELLVNLWRFDEPIKNHIAGCLSLSEKFSVEANKTLEILAESQLIAEGRRKLILGDFDKSRVFFEKVIEQNNSSVEALCGLGEVSFSSGELGLAGEYTARAIIKSASSVKVLNNAGVIFHAQNDYKNSIKALLGAMAADPHVVDPRINFAEVMAAFSREQLVSPELKTSLIEALKWLSNNYPDHSREKLLVENWQLAKSLCDDYRNKFVDSNLKILLHLPENGALKYLFQSWCQVLKHMGITADFLPWNGSLWEKLNSFNPDIFISVNELAYLDQIEMKQVNEWRQTRNLKFGLVLSYDKLTENADFLITFHRNPQRHEDLSRSPLPLISLPFAANPLKHFLQPGRSIWDFFFVGTNSAFKKRETDQYLAPILNNYSGVLAGVNWDRGVTEISVDEVPLCYSFAKICPNYHVTRQIEEYNEVNERTFIIPACGGFQIVDNPRAMKECFKDDEMAVALSPREYQEMFRYFLDRDGERAEYIRKGMRRVFKEHTLFHVLSRFIEFIRCKKEKEILQFDMEHPAK